MFTRTIEIAGIGQLTTQGRSKVWEGSLTLLGFTGAFALRVHGNSEGISVTQAEAIRLVLHNSQMIKTAATSPLAAYTTSGGMINNLVNPSSVQQDIWACLRPTLIEVHRDQCYGLGSGKEGEIAISLGFASDPAMDHLLYLAVINGELHSIYSE